MTESPNPKSQIPNPNWGTAVRVFELSLGQMLWSRRTIFMALIVGAPIVLAVVARVVQEAGIAPVRVTGTAVGGAGMFGMMIWIFYVRIIVPILGVFYGTAMIADEVEEKTITYLFTRPVRRGAVLVGKFLAYLACTVFVVLPSVMVVYLILVPLSEVPRSFVPLLLDLGILALGLAVYGALFGLVGVWLKRPVLVGFGFAFGWEQVALLIPGYLKRFTIAHYLQSLVPHSAPVSETVSLFQAVLRETPPVWVSVFWLLFALAGSLILGSRLVERREYVLEQ